MEQEKTTFPKKEEQQEDKKEEKTKTEINYAKDYTFDELPADWKKMINAKHDPKISKWFTEFQFRKIYIYQLNRLFSNPENNLKFSSNTVKIGFIDPDKIISTDAVEVNDYVTQLNQRNTSNVANTQAVFELTDSKALIFQDGTIPHNNQLFVLSIGEPANENNLDNLYILNSYVEPWKNPRLRNTKSILVTKVSNFTTNNGYPIIIRIQKQLDQDTKISGIKIKYPQTMLFGNIKLIGQINGIDAYTKSILEDDYINFPLLSMPTETDPKVRLLQWWFSEQILSWELVKQFITEKSVLDLIKIGGGTETRKEVIKNARATNFVLGTSTLGKNPPWPFPEKDNKLIKDKEAVLLAEIPTGIITFYVNVATVATFGDVEVEIQDAPAIDSLQKVLLNMITYTYNYYRNFDGATYNNGNPENEIAELRQKFEGQKPEDVITNLWKQWELDNPTYTNSEQAQNFKKIVLLLSKNILSKLSINTGLNDDVKILCPYYFELVSQPIHTEPGKIWEFKDCKVILKSEYFNFDIKDDQLNITMKNNDLSQNKLFTLDENQFNWLPIINELESNSIPSLLPKDWKLSDGEFHKYFINLIIKKENIELALNLYGKLKSTLYSKYEILNILSQISTNELSFNTEKPLNSIYEIEISGIYGYGNYNLILITDKNEEIKIDNINLFSSNEKISLIKIEL